MKRNFHDTGLCVPHKHYMVDTSAKIEKIIDLIEKGSYFIMNRPRQFGKTTTFFLLWKKLIERKDLLVIKLSFEGIGDEIFENSKTFSIGFIKMFNQELSRMYPNFPLFIKSDLISDENGIKFLSEQITDFSKNCGRKIILMIDEVDKSTNNQLFLHFLGMLRDKYLKQEEGTDFSFLSVVLAGVHDVKTIKLKLRPDEEKKINSPWNIAVDFTI
ncbi:MAG: AAA family ATPase, partial [Bacteroidetes bacterium]